MSNIDRNIFEALDFLYLIGEIEEYQTVADLFYQFAELREPIPKAMKMKMVNALKMKRGGQWAR